MSEEIIIQPHHEGLRLDRFLKEELAIPHSLISKLIRQKKILLNQKLAPISHRISAGDVVFYPKIAQKDKAERQKNLPEGKIKWVESLVAYRSDYILILNKPAGLATQGGTKLKESVDDYLDYLKFESFERPRLTHRLDKDTSGILIIARTRKYAQILTKMFENREIKKEYTAILSAKPKLLSGIIDYSLAKNPISHKMEAKSVGQGGLEAVTKYTVIKDLENETCLVKIQPQTGRMHQIRAHFSLIGTPILGDKIYGEADADLLYLHASKISIPHADINLDFELELPDFFTKIL